ncbi:gonadal somatic cell derived factor [Aplochiton taeniatus]
MNWSSSVAFRCQGESLQSIRKTLLKGLNIQTEPLVAAGSLTKIREQWKTSYSAISHTAQERAAPVAYSDGPSDEVSMAPKCCQMTSQIFLKDLGWENWVIYPESFTYIQCATCNSQLELSTQRCPTHYPNAEGSPIEMPCCQPTSQQMVPFLYVDELNAMVISSVQLTRSCDCSTGIQPLPNKE